LITAKSFGGKFGKSTAQHERSTLEINHIGGQVRIPPSPPISNVGAPGFARSIFYSGSMTELARVKRTG